MKRVHKILYVSALVFVIVSLAGCVSAQDLTSGPQPFEWPFKCVRIDFFDLYYPRSTPAQINEATETLAHYFLLEVRKETPIALSMYVAVTINGVEYPMEEWNGSSGSGLWVYKADAMCNDVYEYYYTIDYAALGGLYQGRTTVGSAGNPLRSEVMGFGDMVWFERGSPYQSSSWAGGDITFLWNDPYSDNPCEKIIVVQQLEQGGLPHRTSSIFLFQDDETNFEIFQRPPPYQVLACGDYVEIGVRWNVHSFRHALLQITFEEYHEGKWKDSPRPIEIYLFGDEYEMPP